MYELPKRLFIVHTETKNTSNYKYLLVLFFLLTFGSHIILVVTAIDFAFSHEIQYQHYPGYIICCSFSLWLQIRLYGDFEVL
jgi:hypothetical protein